MSEEFGGNSLDATTLGEIAAPNRTIVLWQPPNIGTPNIVKVMDGFRKTLLSPVDEVAAVFQVMERQQRQMMNAAAQAFGMFADVANIWDTAPKIHRWYAERLDAVCTVLEIDSDNLPEPYHGYSFKQLESDAQVVQWIKERAREGRLQQPEQTQRLATAVEEGRITPYTLSRFIHLITAPSMPAAELWIPPVSEYEIQIQQDQTSPPQRLIFPVRPGQRPVVRVFFTGDSIQHWRPMQLPGQWTPAGASEQTQSVPTHKSGRKATEDDRIRTTLMTWAVKIGKCRSYSAAAAQLGSIDVDTRRNHETKGWLYTDEEMQTWGGFEHLWNLYTTERRKT